jgi:hypothetical protein
MSDMKQTDVDPQIEVTCVEILSDMSANAQTKIAMADWMIDCAERTHRSQGRIPSWPSNEIDGPLMRCACEGEVHPGHPEHIGSLAIPEQRSVSIFLLMLEAETPLNYSLVSRWLRHNISSNVAFRWHKDRSPPLFYDNNAYSWHFYNYSTDIARQRTDESLLDQAERQFKCDAERHEEWTRNVERLNALEDLLGKLAPDADIRQQIASDIFSLRFSVECFERNSAKDPPKLRTMEEQREWVITDAAKHMTNLLRQVAEDKQKIADVAPRFAAFLAELNPADW